MLQIQNINLSKNRALEKAAQERLSKVIPFDEADLAMNDDGFFSDAQKQRLKPKTDLYIALTVIAAFMAFVIAMICFYIGNESDNYNFITGIFIAIFGLCFFGVYWSLALAKQIKRGYGVKRVEGNAELFITYTGKHGDVPVYNLSVGEVRFRLSRQVYDAFGTGEYRVYYFRLLQNEILSVEPFS